MNDQSIPSKIALVESGHASPKEAKGLLLEERANFYILIMLAFTVGAYVYTLRSQSIFSCPATGYDSDTYLAYCHAVHYGDYDHGAFWFNLEPSVAEAAKTAEVLFLGSSRMQFGFSSDPTNHWFSSRSARYYLMGFAYWENYVFEGALLRRLKPEAKAYVINIDTFFEQTETPPAQIVMRESDARTTYRRKQVWQRYHTLICARFRAFCGNDQAFFRSRKTGAYLLKGGRVGNFPVTYDGAVDRKVMHDYTTRATKFLAELPVSRKCVILTMVPTVNTGIGTAKAIADSLGMTFIAPQLDGLSTFDKSHMDRSSAERWSKAFFESAGPQIERCVGKAIAARA